MSEFFVDPQFPDRPTHRDFARLIGAINYIDGESLEGEREADEVAAEFVDPDSLTYMALQRARMLTRMTGVPEHILAAIYVDAFCAGVKFEQDGGHVAE